MRCCSTAAGSKCRGHIPLGGFGLPISWEATTTGPSHQVTQISMWPWPALQAHDEGNIWIRHSRIGGCWSMQMDTCCHDSCLSTCHIKKELVSLAETSEALSDHAELSETDIGFCGSFLTVKESILCISRPRTFWLKRHPVKYFHLEWKRYTMWSSFIGSRLLHFLGASQKELLQCHDWQI